METVANVGTGALIVQKTRLEGLVKISGAKNSSLRLLAASLLTDEDLELFNFPNGLLDVKIHLDMLKVLGKDYKSAGDYVRITEDNDRLTTVLDWNERSIRNTLLILGALTTRFGEGRVPLPGGCKLGERKYDIHVMLLEALEPLYGKKVTSCARNQIPAGFKAMISFSR